MKKVKNFKNMLEELKTIKGQLSEDYIFGDEDRPIEDEMGMEMHHQDSMEHDDSDAEVAAHAQEIIKHEPIVGKIRETAIEGLRKYANHPTSEIYKYFKNVFLDSDKLLTNTGSK